MNIQDWRINPGIWRRILVGYFAPLLAIGRLIKKRRLNYFRQLLVLSRYAFWHTPMVIRKDKQGVSKNEPTI